MSNYLGRLEKEDVASLCIEMVGGRKRGGGIECLQRFLCPVRL